MATPNEITEAATCYACINDRFAAMLYLLDRIRVEQGGEVMTPAEISVASTCFSCIEGKEAAMLYLLEQIVAGGGGGGGDVSFNQGADFDPNGIVTGSVGDIYISSISLGGDGSVWWKTSGTATNTGWE